MSRHDTGSMQSCGVHYAHRCDYFMAACGAEAWIATTEGILESIVQHRCCTVAPFRRICCLLFMRLVTISLTALSTDSVEIGSPFRRQAA
jgi:hypothetical protein